MKKVLIIDDDIGDQILTELALKALGISCDRCCEQDGVEEKISENDYSAILVDYHMAPKDGGEMINDLKKIRPDLNMYIMTGYEREFVEKRVDCKHSGIISKDGLIGNLREFFYAPK